MRGAGECVYMAVVPQSELAAAVRRRRRGTDSPFPAACSFSALSLAASNVQRRKLN